MRIYPKGEDNPNYKTGLSIRDENGKRPSFYQSWTNMKQRCLNKNHPKYKRYGARGITVCDEWLDISNFYKWAIENGWEEGLTIDRIDNDGNYEPSNCRWVTVYSNSRRRGTTKITDEQAEQIRARKDEPASKLAKEFGCSDANIYMIWLNATHVADGECSRRKKELGYLR